MRYAPFALSYSFSRASQWLSWMYIHCKQGRTFLTDRSNGRFIWLDCQGMYTDKRLPLGSSPFLSLSPLETYIYSTYTHLKTTHKALLLPLSILSPPPLPSYICLIPITNTDVTILYNSSRHERLIGPSLSCARLLYLAAPRSPSIFLAPIPSAYRALSAAKSQVVPRLSLGPGWIYIKWVVSV